MCSQNDKQVVEFKILFATQPWWADILTVDFTHSRWNLWKAVNEIKNSQHFLLPLLEFLKISEREEI